MKPLTEKLLLSIVVILLIIQVIELPASFNKIGIPNGSAALNSDGKLFGPMPAYPDNSYYAAYLNNGANGGITIGQAGASSPDVATQLYAIDSGGNFSDVSVSTPGHEVSITSHLGTYSLHRDDTRNHDIIIYDDATGEPMLRIYRNAANDYRLQVWQGGAWVTK